VLIAVMGAQNVLYVNSATFLVSALCLIPMRFHETLKSVREPGSFSASVLDDLKVGFRFVFGTQSTIFLLVIISALYNLGASAFVFILPVYAKEFLQVGPIQLGWLWSGLGIGMLAVSTWLAWSHQGDLHSRLRLIVRGMTVGGLAVCSLSLLDTPLVAAAVVIVVGGSTAVMNPVVWALLQEATPEHLMGRVLTTFSTGSMAAAMAGMTGFGWIADTVGPAQSLIGLGLVLLLTAAVAIRFMRQMVEAQRVAA
jgi:MFS family permease